MPLQQSLLSFYSNSSKKSNGALSSDTVTTPKSQSSVYSGRSKQENSQQQQSQNEQFLRIQAKMVRRSTGTTAATRAEMRDMARLAEPCRKASPENIGSPADRGPPSESYAARPLVPGIKRVREEEQNSATPSTACVPDLEKRRKLVQALGVDDGLQQGGAWAEARAKFEWMTPSRILDGNRRKPGDPLYDHRTLTIPSDVLGKMSASQKQYWVTKSKYMDTVLFFKIGKFYELYEIDAEIGHKELDWKLTVSGVGRCRQVGCPESGIDDAVRKLVSRGYKVGRMEQIETAEQAKRMRGPGATVQRELIEVLTPATLRDGHLQPEAVHVLALKEEFGREGEIAFGFAFADAAAGQFYVGNIWDNASRSALCALLAQVAPQEVLFEIGGLSQDTRKVLQRATGPGLLPMVLTPLQPLEEFMEPVAVLKMLQANKYFKAYTLGSRVDGDYDQQLPDALAPLEGKPLATSSLGALVSHLRRLKSDSDLLPNGVLVPYEVYRGSLRLDGQTISNLELLENMADSGKTGTLIGYLDNCSTLFGKRLLRRWICHPLQNIKEIDDRLDAVDELLERTELTSSLKMGLQKLPDLERLVARVRGLAGSPSLGVIPMAATQVHQRRLKLFCATVGGIRDAYDHLKSLYEGLDGHGSPKARFLLTAAKLSQHTFAEDVLSDIESYIVGKSAAPKLRLQEEEMEVEDESTVEKEARVLSRLMSLFNEEGKFWMDVVEALGTIDVLIAFAIASNASGGKTCRPKLLIDRSRSPGGKGGSILSVKGLWHPYATGGQGGQIVPNDVELGSETSSARTMLLTGPNMGGKSTLLRATCVAVILAQLGCPVPADSCTMSPVDIIFTRLGASDRIMSGESTFMVECSEAASVLQQATSNSLVVLDELGRGTSTFDGYAIAYSVLHDLVQRLDCRLMFATHYHPLTTEFATNPAVILKHMAFTFVSISQTRTGELQGVEASEHAATDQDREAKQLVFLYSLKSGACRASYGLQVSLLAGIPKTVVKAAEVAGAKMHQHLCTVFDSALRRQSATQLTRVSEICAPLSNGGEASTGLVSRYNSLLRLWKEAKSAETDSAS